MNDDVVQDLKQFIAVTISQQTSDIRTDIKQLDEKLDSLSASIGVAIETTNEATDSQLKDHEQRIKHLEHKTV